MAKWKCSMCGYVYDEEKGESSTDTEPGTKFDDLPDDWICPICGASKDAFELLGEEKEEEEELTTEMKHDKEPVSQWKCSVCGYVYDQKAGEPATNTPPSTRFEDLPEDWKCPICGSGKEVFEPQRGEEVHAMVKTTVSDVLISELEAWGVKLVFGIPGTSSLGLVEAVRKNKNMRFIVVRHEENAALAASAYNKFTGKMAACLTIAGPGATNLSTGLYDAKEDGASVISLNGQVEMQYTGPYGFQEIDQDAFFRPVSVYNKTIYDKNATVLLLTKALKFALLQKGVAQLSVPNNVQKELINVKYCRKETCITNFHIIPHDDELKKAVRAIDESKMPVIIAGWGAYEDGNIVLELAQKIKAPILTTYRSKGILPDDNEWMMGILGYVGSPQARKLVNESDLLITFGVGFSKFTNVPTNKPMVQLDINPLKLGKSPYGIPLWGNCSLTTPKLLEKVQLRDDDSILQKIETMKSEWYELLDREADSKKVPLRPPFIMKILSETIPDDAMISVDCGENQWWFGRNFKMKRQRFAMSCYLATMGFGLPGAIAAKLAYPHKTVFCITGDGGFSMAMADFVTAVKYDLPMVVVVLNNKQLAMIQVEQMMEHYSNFATDLLNPNFADYAETCGGVGIKVKRPDELKAAIEKAKTINKPVIVDVDTDPKRFSS